MCPLGSVHAVPAQILVTLQPLDSTLLFTAVRTYGCEQAFSLNLFQKLITHLSMSNLSVTHNLKVAVIRNIFNC
jgi:hypothetical protein